MKIGVNGMKNKAIALTHDYGSFLDVSNDPNTGLMSLFRISYTVMWKLHVTKLAMPFSLASRMALQMGAPHNNEQECFQEILRKDLQRASFSQDQKQIPRTRAQGI
ncbi:hypothetical protein VNO77_38886 [Canavalia gladiata]|uniref:Uncharacterized protein n=1 Tax=Canavalia gladiata TaxID=3824 RepID=A0AAN9KCC6_CANGL